MDSSWNFPARSSTRAMNFPSWAELGHLDFQAGTELKSFKHQLRTTIKLLNFLPVSWLQPILINCVIIYMKKGVLGSQKLWFGNTRENKKQTKSKSKFPLIFGRFLISSWREKRSWVEPSWKSFSLSCGSSRLGSDSSLIKMDGLQQFRCFAIQITFGRLIMTF